MPSKRAPSIDGLAELRSVGQEGQADVFRGTEVETDELVEVVLFPASDTPETAVALQVGRLEDLSEHPNVLPVLSYGRTEDGRDYLVVPASQASMADRMAGGPQPWHEVAGIGIRLASALESAHRLGLVHAGLTPASVKLSSFGDPQLGGFSLVESGGDPSGGPLEMLAFQSPARLEGAPPEPTDDVYALGAVIVSLVTGTPPFLKATDKSIVPIIKRVAADPVPDLRSFGVPEQVAALVERAMAKSPEGRPASAEEFGRSLQQAQVALGVPVTEMALLGGMQTSTPAPAAPPAPAAAPPPPAAPAAPAAGPPPSGPPAGGPPPSGPPAGGPPVAGAKKSKKGLLIGAVVALLLLVGAGGAVALLGGGDDEKKEDDKGQESALDRIKIDEDEEDKPADEEPEEEVTDDTAPPAAGQTELAEGQLLAARLAPEDLPDSFKTFEDNEDPIEDVDTCGLAVDVATLVGQRSVSYQDEATGQFVVSTVAQFAGESATAYMESARQAYDGCVDEEARVVEVVPAQLGDEAIVAQFVIAEGKPEQVHVFFIFSRIKDAVSFTGHLIPSTEQTPPTQLSGELAGRALIRLRSAVQTT